jgi:hypothetical protein
MKITLRDYESPPPDKHKLSLRGELDEPLPEKDPVEEGRLLIRWFSDLPNDTPLTEKLFESLPPGLTIGPHQIPVRQTANIATKLAPLAAGFLGAGAAAPVGGALIGAGLSPGLAATLGLAAEGALGGASYGATNALVEQKPFLPEVGMGAAFGAVGGAAIGRVSSAGAKLEAEFAKRASGPLDLYEIARTTPNMPAKRLALSRERAAQAAFRDVVPEGGTLESAGDVLWERAKAKARESAGKAWQFEDDPNVVGEALNGFAKRIFRVSKPKAQPGLFDQLKTGWGMWVTRAANSLRRDETAFPKGIGHEMATLMERTTALQERYEGELVNRMNKMLHGLPEDELKSGLFNFLTNRSGGRVSAGGAAAAKAWRQMSDDMFRALDERGVRELAPPTHPAGQGELFPDVVERANMKLAMEEDKSGWKMIPIQYRQNYVPHYRDPKVVSRLSRSSSTRRNYIEQLIDSGHAADESEAGALLDQMLRESDRGVPLEIRGGIAQHTRELLLNIPAVTDARVWMRRAIHEHAKRAAEAHVFGGSDQTFRDLLGQLREAGGDVSRFDRLFRLFVNRPDPMDKKWGGIVTGTGNAMNVMYLGPRVAPLQLMQLSNTAARFGWRSVMEGIAGAVRNPGLREMVEQSGATLPSFHLQTGDIDAAGAFGRWWMETVTQMPKFDRGVRIVSAIAGGIEGQRLAQKLALTPFNKVLVRRLEYLGLDPERILAQGGKLRREDIMVAMRNAAHNTQFASHVLDMPERWRTPAGRLIFKLRTFAKQQTPFIGKLVGDAMRGDPAPLVRYLLTYPTVYAAVRPLLDMLSTRPVMDDADQDMSERIYNALSGAAWAGMFGGLGDFINSALSTDKSRLMSMPLGPAAATAVGITSDVAQLGKGNAVPIVQRLSKLPVMLPAWLYKKAEDAVE